MKRLFKIIGIFIIIIIVIIIAVYSFISIRGIPSYEVKKIDYTVASNPDAVERGTKLANMLCANCHKDPFSGKLTGTRMLEAPHEFGIIYSQNITQDKQYGIGEWKDGELLYLLRTGVKKNGVYAPIYMPKLPHMANKDIDAIISFLKSNHEMVLPAAVPDTPPKPSFLTKFLCNIVFKPLPMPQGSIELPDTSNKVLSGRYLAVNLDCYTCHSSDFKKLNAMNPELSKGYFAGGNKPLNKEGKIMVTPNLTPDPETGIGNWTEAKFVKAVKYAFVENDLALRYPMMPYPYLTDAEASSIYQYLRTIPPLKNKVVRSPE